jgi:hypothetical protein
MDKNTRIIEINGVKVEVDLRTAKRVDQFKVGDPVKVLRKRYGDTYEVLPGAIVGFAEFTALPTIEIVAITHSGDVEFIAFNEKAEGIELAPMNRYEMAFDQAAIESTLVRNVEKAQSAVREAETKLEAYRKEIVKAFDLVAKE